LAPHPIPRGELKPQARSSIVHWVKTAHADGQRTTIACVRTPLSGRRCVV
jgi:hypothetical protein